MFSSGASCLKIKSGLFWLRTFSVNIAIFCHQQTKTYHWIPCIFQMLRCLPHKLEVFDICICLACSFFHFSLKNTVSYLIILYHLLKLSDSLWLLFLLVLLVGYEFWLLHNFACSLTFLEFNLWHPWSFGFNLRLSFKTPNDLAQTKTVLYAL